MSYPDRKGTSVVESDSCGRIDDDQDHTLVGASQTGTTLCEALLLSMQAGQHPMSFQPSTTTIPPSEPASLPHAQAANPQMQPQLQQTEQQLPSSTSELEALLVRPFEVQKNLRLQRPPKLPGSSRPTSTEIQPSPNS